MKIFFSVFFFAVVMAWGHVYMPSKAIIGFGFRIIARIIKADDGLKYMPGLDSSDSLSYPTSSK